MLTTQRIRIHPRQATAFEAVTRTVGRPHTFPLLVTSLVVLVAGQLFRLQFRFKYDDSYITFRVAERLADFGTYGFNEGDPTNAASALLFTLLLAVASLLKVNPPLAADLMSAFGLWLCFHSVFRIVLTESKRGGTSERTAALMSFPALLVFIAPVGLYWLGSGMETTLFLGLLTYATSLAISITQHDQVSFRLSLALGVLVLLRFDGIAFAAATLLPLVTLKLTQMNRLQWVKYAAKVSLPATFAFISQIGFNLAVTGKLVPDSAHQKALHPYYAQNWTESYRALLDFLQTEWIAPAALGASGFVILLAARRLRINVRSIARPTLILAGQFIGMLAYLAATPHSDYSRYFLPLFVTPAILLAAIASACVERHTSRRRFSSLVLVVALVTVSFSSVSIWTDLDEFQDKTSGFIEYQMAREVIGEWMEVNLSNATVLSGSLASIAFHNPASTFVDFSGLTSRGLLDTIERGDDPRALLFESASHHVEMSWGSFESPMPADWDGLPELWETPIPLVGCDSDVAFETTEVAVAVRSSDLRPLMVVSEILWKECSP